MNMRLLAAAILISVFANSASLAGPVFTFQAAPPGGSSAGLGNVFYTGPNNFGGSENSSGLMGITGVGTPLNSGRTLFEPSTDFSIYSSSSGFFDIGSDFTSVVTSSSVNEMGGVFSFDGFLSSAAASYFGVPSGADLTGTAAIQLTPATRSGEGNYISRIQVTFSPNAVPEPSSVILLGTSVLGLVAFGLARARRGGRAA